MNHVKASPPFKKSPYIITRVDINLCTEYASEIYALYTPIVSLDAEFKLSNNTYLTVCCENIPPHTVWNNKWIAAWYRCEINDPGLLPEIRQLNEIFYTQLIAVLPNPMTPLVWLSIGSFAYAGLEYFTPFPLQSLPFAIVLGTITTYALREFLIETYQQQHYYLEHLPNYMEYPINLIALENPGSEYPQ